MAVRLENGHNEIERTWSLPDVHRKKEGNVAISQKKENVEVKSPILESISILKEMPEVREDKVVLGRKLIADPHYPSDEVLDKIADALLGDHADLEDE